MTTLWEQPDYEYVLSIGEYIKINSEWLYHHILEPELRTIRYWQHHHYLKIYPPPGIKLSTLDGFIYLNYDTDSEATKALDMVNLLIR